MARAPRPDAALGALLLAAGAACLAPADALAHEDASAPAGGGVIRIAADPPRLLLGKDGAAELRVTTPADVQDLSITASVGRVEDLRRLPTGGFVARYRPPPGRVPQVAILSALGRTPRGTQDGWLAVPLSGQGDARIRAAPGSEIELRIGDATFGPRTTGKDGLVVIPIVVPPGIREAHHGFRPIDLRIPETPLLHAALERSVVFADRAERVRVRAYVVAPHGAARRGDGPVFEVSRGSVSVTEREPGALDAVWTLPPGRAGEERLVVRLPAAPASRSVLRVEAVAGPAAAIAVAFDRDALVAGEDSVIVTARALDAAGNPVPAALGILAEGGELTDLREPEPGAVEARLRVGALEGRREVRITASAPGTGISAVRALPLRPGPPAVARLRSGVLRADGRRSSLLRLEIEDAHGNPVEATPAVTAERGQVVAVSMVAPGAYDVRYVGPAVAEPTEERIAASLGGLEAIARPVLVPPESRWVVAPSAGLVIDVRGRFTGPRSGVTLDRANDWAPAASRGVDLSWRLEAGLAGTASGGAAALLAGASAARVLGPNLVLRGVAAAGALLGHGASPAGKLAVEIGSPRRRFAPFVEVSVLGAGHGAPGSFAAFGISGGFRTGVEARGDGHDPDRR